MNENPCASYDKPTRKHLKQHASASTSGYTYLHIFEQLQTTQK